MDPVQRDLSMALPCRKRENHAVASVDRSRDDDDCRTEYGTFNFRKFIAVLCTARVPAKAGVPLQVPF